MKLQAYAPIDELDGFFVFVPSSFIPIWAGTLGELSQRWVWYSDDDWAIAYQIIARLRACMLTCPAKELIEGNNRIYRLLSSAMFGTVWSVASTEPLVIEPSIPDVPDMSLQLPGNLAQIQDARAKLQTIIDSMASDDEDIAAIIQELAKIGVLLV